MLDLFLPSIVHHEEEFGVVDDPVSVDVGLVDNGRDFVLADWLTQRSKHDGQFAAVDVTVAVLKYCRLIKPRDHFKLQKGDSKPKNHY